MGLLDFLKPGPKKQLTDLPPPPPPPSRGLDIDLGDFPQPPAEIPSVPLAPPAASPAPLKESEVEQGFSNEPQPLSIPVVSADSEPAILMNPVHEEAPVPENTSLDLPDLPDLDDTVVLEPTVSQPQRIVSQDSVKPMFISVEDYQEILNSINVIKDALRDTEDSMNRLNELKNTQEKILEDWRGHLEDAERKITYVDQVIFRGE